MPIRDTDGCLLTNEGDQSKSWAEHFKSVLNRAPPGDPVDMDEPSEVLATDPEPPHVQEIMKALKKLKAGKCPGIDNVSAVMLKVAW